MKTAATREADRRWRASPEGRTARREQARRHYERRPELYKIRGARRRARKLAAVDPNANHEAIKTIYTDAYYASQFTGEPWAVDHRVPLCRSGKHTPRNLRAIPARLNAIKGRKLDREVRDPEFKAWLAQARLGPAFEQTAYLVRLGGRIRLYHLD
jgi:hypothetical protein